MEILVIGGLLVLLMVFVSTKIKASAAKAYERETIEAPEFRLEKPEGFMHPLREGSEFAFEAYSKLFGTRSTRNVWRARARLRVTEGHELQRLLDEASIEDPGAEAVYSDTARTDQKICIIQGIKTVDEQDYEVIRKIVEHVKREKTYELRITLMADYREEYSTRVRQMIDSFEVV